METNNTAKKKRGFLGTCKWIFAEYSVIVIVVVMVIIATCLKGTDFFSLQNFINIIRNNAVLGIIALGMAFVIITGNIDLSVGAQLVISGISCLSVLNALNGAVPDVLACAIAIVTAIVVSAAISTITSIIVTKGRVPSFIVTLGMQYVLRSFALFFMDARGITGEVKIFQDISNKAIGNLVPWPIVYFAVVFVIALYISKKTVLGRHIYAVGSNEKATRLSGINTDWVKIKAFILLGIAVGIAAVTEASRMNSINSASTGTGYELSGIAMPVVGGVAMEGGKGKIVNVLFGVFIMGIINNMLTLIGMDVYLVNAVKGAVIILAVLFQRKDKEA